MEIAFTKMHGLGNDFVIIDATRKDISISAEQVRLLADRHYGIGCDHVLLLELPKQPGVDFFYRIINADGSEAGFSGNGARCLAKYVFSRGLIKKRDIVIATISRSMKLHIDDDDQITVEVGRPITEPEKIPFLVDNVALQYDLQVEDEVVVIGAISVGNPHAVLLVPDVATVPVEILGPKIENHPRFPERVNVNFMQIVDKNMVKLRVYERGSGETLACGSGACASVAIGRLWNLLAENVVVKLTGGDLEVSWKDVNASIFMTGPAVDVFDGRYQI